MSIFNRGYAAIGLHNPKDNNNVGSVLRAAGVYDVAMVAVQGTRYKRACTDTRAQHKHMPFLQVDDLESVIPFDCVPVAVDLIDGAKSLISYVHPERAFYIFGPEDGTLGKSVINYCRDTIFVPTNGCMNLAATVNVILYDRLLKNFKSR